MGKTSNELAQETQEIWDSNATFWDGIFGDTGNRFHRTIVEPTTLALLGLHPGEMVLEVGCGNGAFARTLAALGVAVMATDFSANLLDCAKARTTNPAITYACVDATNEDQLLALGEQRFDAIVSTMALMDMTTIDPLFSALPRLLKPDGRFVVAIAHPCFNSNGASKQVETHDRNGELVTTYAMKVATYRTPFTERGIGIIGQPTPHYFFHRPISLVFSIAFRAGLVLDGFEEPVDGAEPNEHKWYAWSNYKEIPPVLVARFRVVPSLYHSQPTLP